MASPLFHFIQHFSNDDVIAQPLLNTLVAGKIHGSRETWLETELSVSVGTSPPFTDQGADAAPKGVGGEYRISPDISRTRFYSFKTLQGQQRGCDL